MLTGLHKVPADRRITRSLAARVQPARVMRWPLWVFVSAMLIANFLDCFEITFSRSILGVNLYGGDLIIGVLLVLGLCTLVLYRKSFSKDVLPCLALLALLALDFGRGISQFGLKAAGNSVRNLATFAIPALTMMLLRPLFQVDAARVARWLNISACLLCSVALLRWMGVLATPLPLENEVHEVVRTLPSDFAIVIGQAFIATIYVLIAGRGSPWWWGGCAGVFGAVAVSLQHRSVWIATLAGLGWFAIRTVRSARRWLAIGVVSVLLFGLVVTTTPEAVDALFEMVDSGVGEVIRPHSTWSWRVQGYEEAAERVFADEPASMMLGPPSGWATVNGLSFASTHIHDRYLDTLAYYGVAGAGLLLAWFAILMKRSLQWADSTRVLKKGVPPGAVFLQALLLSEFIYLVPYFGGFLQGAVLGLVWVAVKRKAVARMRRILPVRWPQGRAFEARRAGPDPGRRA